MKGSGFTNKGTGGSPKEWVKFPKVSKCTRIFFIFWFVGFILTYPYGASFLECWPHLQLISKILPFCSPSPIDATNNKNYDDMR